MTLTILFFGRLRDAAATAAMTAEHSFDTVTALTEWLASTNAHLGNALAAPGVRVAIDQHFAARDASLASAREVAFMSPLSGG